VGSLRCAWQKDQSKDTAVIITADKGVQYEVRGQSHGCPAKSRRAARGPFRQARRLSLPTLLYF
jgi:hypothetical protein